MRATTHKAIPDHKLYDPYEEEEKKESPFPTFRNIAEKMKKKGGRRRREKCSDNISSRHQCTEEKA